MVVGVVVRGISSSRSGGGKIALLMTMMIDNVPIHFCMGVESGSFLCSAPLTCLLACLMPFVSQGAARPSPWAVRLAIPIHAKATSRASSPVF